MANDPSMALATIETVFVLFASQTRCQLFRTRRVSLVYCSMVCVCTQEAVRVYLFADGWVD